MHNSRYCVALVTEHCSGFQVPPHLELCRTSQMLESHSAYVVAFTHRPIHLPVMQGMREEQQAMAEMLDARYGVHVLVCCDLLLKNTCFTRAFIQP